MTISITHPFVSGKSDGVDPTLVQPSNWNAAHAITMATGKVLGRATAGTGAVEELPTTGTGNVMLSSAPTSTGAMVVGTVYSATGSVGGLSFNTWVTIYTMAVNGQYDVNAYTSVGAAGYSVAGVATKDGGSGAMALGGGGAGAMECQCSGANIQVRQTASGGTLTAYWTVTQRL